MIEFAIAERQDRAIEDLNAGKVVIVGGCNCEKTMLSIKDSLVNAMGSIPLDIAGINCEQLIFDDIDPNGDYQIGRLDLATSEIDKIMHEEQFILKPIEHSYENFLLPKHLPNFKQDPTKIIKKQKIKKIKPQICEMPGCDNITTHKRGYCSAICCVGHRYMMKHNGRKKEDK